MSSHITAVPPFIDTFYHGCNLSIAWNRVFTVFRVISFASGFIFDQTRCYEFHLLLEMRLNIVMENLINSRLVEIRWWTIALNIHISNPVVSDRARGRKREIDRERASVQYPNIVIYWTGWSAIFVKSFLKGRLTIISCWHDSVVAIIKAQPSRPLIYLCTYVCVPRR